MLHFVTNLPPLGRNMVVLTVVDWFFEVSHFIALPKLPSAMFFVFTAYRWTWSLTGVLSLSLNFRGSIVILQGTLLYTIQKKFDHMPFTCRNINNVSNKKFMKRVVRFIGKLANKTVHKTIIKGFSNHKL